MNEYKVTNFDKEQFSRLNESDVVYALLNKQVDSGYLMALKEETGISGEVLSGWLHVTPKTLRSYLIRKSSLSDTIGEQVLLLAALFKHGVLVFGSNKEFEIWLSRDNVLLDGLKPADMLGSVSGIRLIDNRLYGIEYGDNA